MSHHPVGPPASTSFMSQLQATRTDVANLLAHSNNLSGEFGNVEQQAFTGYNATADAYENAVQASHDDPNTFSGGYGSLINLDLTTINNAQTALTTGSQQATGDLAFCQTEVGRISAQLTQLAATAPGGLVAHSVQRALFYLNQGGGVQGKVAFDDRLPLQELPDSIQQVTGLAAIIAADQPGLDVSSQGAQAETYLTSMENNYESIEGLATTPEQTQLQASKSYSTALARLDTALSQLQPSKPKS